MEKLEVVVLVVVGVSPFVFREGESQSGETTVRRERVRGERTGF